jgi:hypothetical protein
MFFYYQKVGGEESWSAVPAAQLPKLVEQQHPMFVTVLAVNKLVDDLPREQRDKLSYEGPFYVDWDGPDIDTVIPKVHAFMDKLVAMGVDLEMARWYATGGKGFHMELPCECFMDKAPKGGVSNLPVIYKEMVFAMYVDTIDMRVYSQGRGRQWRQPNVLRENGRYKVQLSVKELRELTADSYITLTSSTRPLFDAAKPELNAELSIAFARAQQKVEEQMKVRKARKVDPLAGEKAKSSISIRMMMDNVGIKEGIGFHQLALQLAIIANTAGMDENQLVEQCAELINNHESDGNRYNTPFKRAEELRRHGRCHQGRHQGRDRDAGGAAAGPEQPGLHAGRIR